MRMPGRWLRTVAGWICAPRTMERVIDPVVADLQTEFEDALQAHGAWRAALICLRGYAAFWKAVGLHAVLSGPRSLGAGVAADGWTAGRMIGYSLMAFLGFTLLLVGSPMLQAPRFGLTLALFLLPQAIAVSIPIALPLGIVLGVRSRRVSAPPIRSALFLAGVATLLAFTAMLMVPVANQAYRVAVAEALDLRGVTKYSLPRGVNELSLSELARGAKVKDADGYPQTARRFNRTFHLRLALPVATFVLSLLALGLCSVLGRRGWRLAAIVVAVAVYWASLAFSESNTTIPPPVLVWAPNLVFTALSFALLRVLADQRAAPFTTGVPR